MILISPKISDIIRIVLHILQYDFFNVHYNHAAVYLEFIK